MLQGILILAATSGMIAPALPPKAKAQKTVMVVVDYVSVGSADFDAAGKRARKGPNHDADLLAALREGGATDFQGARVTAKADQTVHCESRTTQHGALIIDDKSVSGYLQTVFKAEITPHFPGAGGISIRLKLDKIDTVLDPVPGKPHRKTILTTALFRDGKTTMIDTFTSSHWRSGAGAKTQLHAPWKQMVFLTATVNVP
ncbi:MAG: hypothetical protein ABIY70_04500 [Capsulimonas sp.]|uniref:hypothetical protein n=1 Tax=Capsulimonas sp. TaxID=2494211 RepID=UPI003266D78D